MSFYSRPKPNEIRPEFLSIHSLTPFTPYISSSRSQMFYSHLSQALVIKGASEKTIQTGMEYELGKYTFSVKMPEDGVILAVLYRYPTKIGIESIAFTPSTILIYENQKREIGMVEIPYYHTTYTAPGFRYVKQPGYNEIGIGQAIPKDTVFADSPSKGPNGEYMYSTELNIAFMSHPAGAEDGILISSDVIDKLKFKVYETRIVEFGSKYFPLNLYGTHDKYKPFPEIGDEIRHDGILIALRQFDDTVTPVTMSAMDLTEVDYVFDKLTYVRGKGGKVVDICMYHDENKPTNIPYEMVEHVLKYSRAMNSFYISLLETEKKIKETRRKKFGDDTVVFTPQLHRLLVEAKSMVSSSYIKDNAKISKMYRDTPMDDFHIVFKIEYEITPSIGFKMSGSYGDKGVICDIVDPSRMPVDAEGNRADVIMDAGSTINRMNVGRPYEQYFSAAARDVTRQIRRTMFTKLPDGKVVSLDEVDPKTTRNTVLEISKVDQDVIMQAHQTALDLYEIVSPKQYEMYSAFGWEDIVEHVQDIVEDGIRLYMPVDNPPEVIDMVLGVEKRFKLCYGPVTFYNEKGKLVKTKYPVRLAPYSMMLLERIADDWSSVAYSKLHHFGILTTMTKYEKYALPYRNSPVRTMGETESRLYSSYCGRWTAAEMMDRSNSPATHKEMIRNILESDHPSNIDNTVDRTKVPLGGSKPLGLISHISYCFGWKFKYKPGNHVNYILNNYTVNGYNAK